ncbi:MAG TPA: hypothetical protein PLI22_03975 [Caldisericia bacterium]|jgi:hypothetical protein|nr:hypothetical protein [Caldisericia bacterium]
MWKEVNVYNESKLYETILKVIKHEKAQYPATEIFFSMKNNKSNFKIEFCWQDENICGIKVMKEVEGDICQKTI